MLAFFGFEFPRHHERYQTENPKRAAKLQGLEMFFNEKKAIAFNMLPDDALSRSNSKRGRDLILNSHGNTARFGTLTPKDLFAKCLSKGLEDGSFDKIYLMACKSALAPEENGQMDDYATAFKRVLIEHKMDCTVIGTMGNLSYKLERHEVQPNMHFFTVVRMFIKKVVNARNGDIEHVPVPDGLKQAVIE